MKCLEVCGGSQLTAQGVVIGGLSAVHQFTRIGAFAMIGGMSGVRGDVVPYGLAHGVYAALRGLNIVGLKRRKFARERIHTLRRAYRALFLAGGHFAERLAAVAREFADDAAVMQIIAFIREGKHRPLCRPEQRREDEPDGAAGTE